MNSPANGIARAGPWIIPAWLFFLLITCYATASCQDSVRDADGNAYLVIRIGTQTWMGENLRCRHDDSGNPAMCFAYLGKDENEKRHGLLYPWESAMNGEKREGSRGLCPQGWHVPTDKEWTALTEVLGGQDKAGKTLRDTLNTGFNLTFGGNYYPSLDSYSYLDQQAYFWTSTPYTGRVSWMRNLGYRSKNINRSTVPNEYCFSVRCVKDPG